MGSGSRRRPPEAESSRSDEDEDEEEGEITAVDRVISDLREEYRSTHRRGVLDSREDFDPLVLARELDADVVTEDTGINWAEDVGLRYLRGQDFPTLLDESLGASVEDRYPERSPSEARTTGGRRRYRWLSAVETGKARLGPGRETFSTVLRPFRRWCRL